MGRHGGSPGCGPLLLLSLALACTEPRVSRDLKKPRVQIVLLATSGDVVDPGLASKVTAGWRKEEARCQKPSCELLKLAINARPEHLAALSYDAVLSRSPGPAVVSTNVDGGVSRLAMTRVGNSLEVLGYLSGGSGDDVTERAMQFGMSSVGPRAVNGTVIISDDCTAELEKTIGTYGGEWWLLAAAVGRACDGSPASRHVRSTVVAGASEVGLGYTRLVLDFDKNTRALLSASTTFESWN